MTAVYVIARPKDGTFLTADGWRRQPAKAQTFADVRDAQRAARAAAVAFSSLTSVVDCSKPPTWATLRQSTSLHLLANRPRVQTALEAMGLRGPWRWGY